EGMFGQVRQTALPGRLVVRAGVHHHTQGNGAHARHGFGDHLDSVLERRLAVQRATPPERRVPVVRTANCRTVGRQTPSLGAVSVSEILRAVGPAGAPGPDPGSLGIPLLPCGYHRSLSMPLSKGGSEFAQTRYPFST